MNKLVEVLIVEDSPTQALRLRQILEAEGYRVTLARDGAEGLRALQSQRPTLVITDVNMPEMDGYELCRRMKADEKLRELPVILLTTLSDPEDIVRGLECGADNFLTKPYEKDYLLSRIRHILLNRQLRQSSHAEAGIEVIFAGQRRFLTSERIQILDLLLASFETAVTKTRQLEESNNELRNALETIEALKAGYLTLLESNPDGMVVVDRGGTIRYSNPAARALIGGGAELVGSPSIFHLDLDATHQISFPRAGGEALVVEQRAASTTWEGDTAYLVSLRDITALVRMQEEIRALSLFDELTGLHNRRGFVTLAGQQLKLADRNGQVVSLLFVDLDNMKTINDTQGHKGGDAALVEAASILREACREADVVARLGGDEFVVLQTGPNEDEAEAVKRRLQMRLEAHKAEQRPYRLAMSIGIASRYPGEPASLEDLLHRADQCMYEAKVARRQSAR